MTHIGSNSLRSCALVVIAVAAGCGAEQDAIETASSALLQNRPYIQGGTIYQTHGGTDAWGTPFNNKIYFTFVRTDSRIGVIEESNTGSNGQNAIAYALSDTSQGGASTIVFNNTLYLFYVGMNRHLYMKTSSDGRNWGATTELDSQPWWLDTPAPVVYNGSLIVFGVLYASNGANGGKGSVTVRLAAGNVIPSGLQFGLWATTDNTPAVVVWNNTIYVAWLYVDFHGTGIYVSHYLGENNPNGWWSGQGELPDGTGTLNGSGDNTGIVGRPGLFVEGSQVEMVYRGNDSHIYRSYTSNGTTFSTGTPDAASTTNQSAIPFLASGSSDAWVVYVGTNGQIYTAVE